MKKADFFRGAKCAGSAKGLRRLCGRKRSQPTTTLTIALAVTHDSMMPTSHHIRESVDARHVDNGVMPNAYDSENAHVL